MIKYKVVLSADEQSELKQITSQGKHSARKIKRAQILLMSNSQSYSDEDIAELLSIGIATVYRTKRYFVEYGLSDALHDDPRPGQPRKLDANQEALLIAITCSEPPKGRCRWTLTMLGDQLISMTELETISPETIRQRLNENDLKPWQKKMWCIGKLDAAYIARMEHILDLYAEPADPMKPIINFDEAGKQLVGQVNEPKPIKPGKVAKEDYEYQRAGMANIFMCFDRHRGWRKAKVTERKTAIDFAECMRELVDQDYPESELVRVVLDNLSTHTEASLYKAFPPQEARRILRRLEFHYTPKHASWLNMAEIEIGNMNQQCLDRRIPDKDKLVEELTFWQTQRNEKKASINWMFNLDTARTKLDKAYTKLNYQN
jgi:transposase